MFEFLFKYRPAEFSGGVLELAAPWQWLAVVALVAALVAWWRLVPRAAMPLRSALAALRAALVVLLAFAMFMPELVVQVPKEGERRVAVMIDDSLSMRVEDGQGRSGAAMAAELFTPGAGRAARALESRFAVEYFRFADGAAPLGPGESPAFGAPGTDIAGALDDVLASFAGTEPPALVLVSDGRDDGVRPLADAVDRLRLAGVAVHAVGVGAGPVSPDLAVGGVRAPRSIRLGDVFETAVTVRHRGLGGERVRVLLEDGGLVVAQAEVTLPDDRDSVRVDLDHRFEDPGPHDLAVRVPLADGELLLDNNEIPLALDVVDDVIDVLHIEGEPRFEVKFIRRALADDYNVRLVSLVHTSDSKLYRVGVEHAEELKDGFPANAAELFDFDVVILGSVEAARLDAVRQELLAEFVGRRGGGLLLLGGRYSFAEGGYAGTRVAAVMPVVLGEASVAADAVRVAPTLQALRHPLFRDFPEQDWQSLPALSVINPITRLKPGASLLLSGEGDGGRALVAFAAHRYGRGRAAAFPVRNSWRWQMHADVSAGDTTHELFWRRLVRWLASAAGGRVELQASGAGVPGRAVPVVARVMDEDYRPLADAHVTLTVATPTGERMEQRLARVPGGEGRYEGRFTPTAPGRYDLRANVGGGDLSAALPLMVAAAGNELAGAGVNETLLARLAEATGGAFHRADEAHALATAIAIPGGGATEVRRLPLWDMPALLLLALLLACADWALRRRGGYR